MIRGMLLAALATLAVAPAVKALDTLDEIHDCMDANLPDPSSVQIIVMKAHDRIGSVTQTRAKIYWKKGDDDLSNVLVRLSDPPEMRGAAILMLEKKSSSNDILMYLPELKRVKRVTGHMMSGSMFGTDFSYEEFESLQGLGTEDFEESLGAPAEVDGRPVYVIEARAREGLKEKPNYERTVTYVDQATCSPLKVEFFERGDRVRKRMQTDASSIEKIGERNVVRRLQIEDLRDETRTELEIEEIDFDAKVSRSLFSTRALERMGGKSF
jgi:outer membrane lipoprotein-sorting protein